MVFFQNRTPCMFFGGGSICSSKGLSSHFCKSILTNKLSLMNATKFDKCQWNFDCAFNAFRIRMVIKAVQIWIITAFSDVPINDLICNNCLISLKNISTCHLLLYNSPIVLGDQLKWFVIISITINQIVWIKLFRGNLHLMYK